MEHRRKSRTLLFGGGSGIFSAGLLVGIWLQSSYGPNRIRFVVSNKSHVYLQPRDNDRIEWLPIQPKTEVPTIAFHGEAPCKEANEAGALPLGKPCTFQPPKINHSYSSYTYGCIDSSGGVACSDPGWNGGGSTTGGVSLTFYRLLKILSGFVNDALSLFTGLFAGAHTPVRSDGAGVAGAGPAGPTSPISANQADQPNVSCDKQGNLKLYANESSTAPLGEKEVLTAVRGAYLYWEGAPDFQVSIPKPICGDTDTEVSSGKPNSDGTVGCQVAATAPPGPSTITIQAACKQNSPQVLRAQLIVVGK